MAKIKPQYDERRKKIYDWMAKESIAMALIEDCEGRRDSALRYLTGMPGDALLFLSSEKKSLLVPWDVNLAKIYANADSVRAYSDFDRVPFKAAKKAAEFFKLPPSSHIEVPACTPYPQFLRFIESLADFDVLCRSEGLGTEIEKMRSIKDAGELILYRRAGAITDEVIDALAAEVASGTIKTEVDAALFVDAEGRKRGCEGVGFETLAAGPERSFAIHSFPAYSGESFGGAGLSIIDFGLKYAGYTTDVTVTFARDLNKEQEKLVALVEKARKAVQLKLKPGVPTREIAAAADALFAKAHRAMPHALGHGIGLDAHEGPAIRNRSDNEWTLEAGMVVAIEPGLYDPLLGGVRFEDDFIIADDGAEQITHSRIVRL